MLRQKSFDGEPGLKLKWSVTTDEVFVENVYVYECEEVEQALSYFYKGQKNKIMASHQMNQSSSRSHCILTFTVHQFDSANENT